ncbi:Asp-tRNA(Asn)/Glu-tRNA(Gln) amidotransferase subunit GatB [Sporolactobacillus kofuensis]|jgi:aspartyl-tRNA(Asn)/glutamyl-tRNA(Gln) amidotransferase subunit B|uniref:Aspartyl/glutamyl-tRNA(Asn/Gln) amidotransferase subunit B n=2 Tax=Sporolactobacillus TaxID=2077 RepID=V6IUS9_9BACL|nr:MULTISPECIES: Asp-tRNA(Asn)/Glu-tRNA(Gln) amidotransferase subunit GatB [Sporolactobacillus]EST10827.1 aspartyl/glutamyl-tRNA amidotransferase subunit B [Sporolactobacillus laevolacticus DSM 442]MCO7175404.1 Asp-tRNA(Asn)/Glu-tRNA(Gln) amidotransferase subunit GatB [Sporolactobacillus kofuensis]
MSNFETVIGLEVHVELKTKTKAFCGCANQFGAEPNTNTCPICLGHPGVLPILNHEAVDYAIKAALALNCEISRETKFDRKNYFYPDNPKAYQISQFDQPIGRNGYIEIELDGEKKRIGVHRLHLEEDAGKLNHLEDGSGSLVDFNRVGTPLIEIVSEADMRDPHEAYLYLEKLKAIMQYIDVSDVKMEEGSLRCDANISIRPFGQTTFGTKTELKNLNSFTFVEKGLAYEEKRQEKVLLSGGEVVQETRRYNDATKATTVMRGKEGSEDYRYFPEPDIIKLKIDQEWIDRIEAEIPELPDSRQKRYVEEFGLPEYDAMVLTQAKTMSDFFQDAVAEGADAKLVSNWLMGDVSAYLNSKYKTIDQVPMTAKGLAKLVQLIEKGTISSKIAKKVFKDLIEKGGDPEEIVKAKGLVQISDEGALREMLAPILEANKQSMIDYKNGKDRALGFLVGQVMKQTHGKANPKMVNKIILEEIDKL